MVHVGYTPGILVLSCYSVTFTEDDSFAPMITFAHIVSILWRNHTMLCCFYHRAWLHPIVMFLSWSLITFSGLVSIESKNYIQTVCFYPVRKLHSASMFLSRTIIYSTTTSGIASLSFSVGSPTGIGCERPYNSARLLPDSTLGQLGNSIK